MPIRHWLLTATCYGRLFRDLPGRLKKMKYRLQDLIDLAHFQKLQDRLDAVFSFPSAIIDNEGNILTATAWQDVCTKFYRCHKECEKECIKSDQYILGHIHEADPTVSYRCPHGLVDNATPIIIEGEHLANFFTGQFFLEKPDLAFFRAQAKRYGFDEAEFLEAVKRVPIWTREQLDNYLAFIRELIGTIAEIGLKKLRAIEAQQRTEESEKRLQAMFDLASIGFAQVDPKTGRLIRVNNKMSDITGYSNEELLSLRFSEITHPEDRDRDWEAFQSIVRGDAPGYRIEKRYIRKDGSIIWVNVNMTLIRDATGEAFQAMAAIEDITTRREAVERLQESEKNLAAVINASPESTFLIDTRGLVVTCNPVFAGRMGLTPDQVTGACIYDFLPPDIVAGRRSRLEEVIRTGEPCVFEDSRAGRFLRHYLQPVLDAKGQVQRVAVFAHDITEYRDIEANLTKQNLLLGAVRRAQNLFISGHEPARVFNEILHIVMKTTGSAIGFLDEVLHDADGTPYKANLAISEISWDGESQQVYEQLKERNPELRNLDKLASALIAENRLILANDATRHPKFHGLSAARPIIHNFMGIPLHFRDELIGVLGIANRSGGYTEQIAEDMAPLTQACAAMIWAGRALSRERKNAEELQKSEERYRRFVETANEGIWAMDRTHRTTYVNHRMAEMLGRDPADIIGRPVEDFMFEEDLPDHRARMARRHAGNDAIYQHRFRRPDGSAIHTLVSARAILDAAGEFDGSFAMFTDITELKQAEIALRESEARLELALEGAGGGIIDWDLQNDRIRVNTLLAEMLGFSPEDFPDSGESFRRMIHPDDRAAADAAFQAVLSGNTPAFDIEERFLTKQGEWKWILARGKIVARDAAGKALRYLGTHVDITKHKRMEEMLRLQHELAIALGKTMCLEDSLSLCLSAALRGSGLDSGAIYLSDEESGGFRLALSEGLSKDFLSRVAFIEADSQNARLLRTGRSHYVRHSDWTQDRGKLADGLQALAIIPIVNDGRVIGSLNLASHTRESVPEDIRLLLESLAALSGVFLARALLHEELQKNERRYRELVENANSIILRMDVEGNIRFFNEFAERFFGYSKEEVLGKNVVGTIVPEMDSAGRDLRAMIADIGLHPERYESNENENRRRDGSRVYVAWANKPLLDESGKVVEILCVGNDITRRKLAEEALLRSEENYGMLFREMMNGFAQHEIICDAQGNPTDYRFLAVNPAFERMTGLRAEAVVGRTVLEVLPATEPSWIQRYGRVALTGQPIHFESFTEALGKWFEVTAFRPTPGQFACIFTDITEQKRAEEEKARLESQLQQAQKMESVGRLAGGVAHDFTNMLGVIIGHTEMASCSPGTPQAVRESLEEIRKAAERSANLTRKLLAFARKQTVKPQVMDLNDTVFGMLKMLRRLIGENIRLSMKPGNDLWPIYVDPSQIDQVLANLCVNARDAIAGVGEIIIETGIAAFDDLYCSTHPGFQSGEYVWLSVSDNGCGMDAATLEHIFEPFFTTKGVGEGTGLGLAMVYGVVKQNNGFIRVDSDPGIGTTFTLYFPRHLGEAEKTVRNESERADAGGQETILLVEDEPAILKLMTRMLQQKGYRVLHAQTPGEGIRLAREYPGDIDLLITDVIMPEMNGRELASAVLSLYPRLKCLFMSGYTADVIAHQGLMDRYINFIQKPFSTQSMLAKVREVLNRGD